MDVSPCLWSAVQSPPSILSESMQKRRYLMQSSPHEIERIGGGGNRELFSVLLFLFIECFSPFSSPPPFTRVFCRLFVDGGGIVGAKDVCAH